MSLSHSAPRREAPARRRLLLTASALAILVAGTAGAAEVLSPDPATLQNFDYLDTPYVSGDGRVMAGDYEDSNGQYLPWKWTEQEGFSALPTYGVPFMSHGATALNYDGSVIVGYVADPSLDSRTVAAKWTATGIQPLGLLNDGNSSYATDVSDDGSAVVGKATDGHNSDAQKAVRWTAAGIQDLGEMPNNPGWYEARAVSGDGNVVIGWFDGGNYEAHGFRWTEAGGMTEVARLSGGHHAMVRDINRDGSVIVGQADDVGDGIYYPIRWTDGGQTATKLELLPGAGGADALAVNADGSVVVDYASIGTDDVGFRWTETGGMQSVDDWMRSHGVTIDTPLAYRATGVSADGKVVVGLKTNYKPFIARVVDAPLPVEPGNPGNPVTDPPLIEPGAGGDAGMMDVENYMASLAGRSASAMAVKGMDVALHGAHGSPMQVMPGVGRNMGWVTGDYGYHEGHGAAGRVGAGEVGLARGFEGGLVGRIAIGRTFDRADLDTGGTSSQDGSYILPEATFDLGGIKTTVSAYVNKGRLEVNRGYLNGTALDISHGKTDAMTYAGRIRFDWLNAFEAGGTFFTPYASHTTALSRIDAYTETGGAFPARFDPQTEHFNVSRIGLDLTHPITDQVTLLGRVEASYRFEKHMADTAGTILGLNDFAISGAEQKQVWGRAAAGVEFKAGAGTASLVLNATTEGSDPKVWLATSWRVSF
jgi:probable HAF family extracellular repeat protein